MWSLPVMKILLISANPLIAPSPVYPIGLDYVAGTIADRHEVKIVDLNEQNGMERMTGLIEDFAPHLIGLSLRNIDNQDAFDTKTYVNGYQQLVSRIRAMTSAKIVLGGSGFTIFPLELMALLDADYGIIGDGEQLLPLLDTIESQSDARGIPGVVTKNSPFAGFPGNARMPFQRSFDADSPHVRYYLKQGGILNLQTKRGCPNRCIYCTYPHIDGSRLRLIDPDDVARTARMLQEAGAKYLFITDSTFNCNADHSLRVAKAFIKAGLSIPWGAFFAPFTPPAGYYKIMAEAGLSHCEFGTESLCDRVLSAYGKPFRAKDVFFAHEQASDAGLHVAHYLLFGGPGEDEITIAETLSNAEKLEKAVMILFCGIRIYPHTALHAIAVRQGQITRDQNLLEPVFYRSPTLNSDKMAAMLTAHAAGRPHWVLGSGSAEVAYIVSRLHARGHYGPLWEQLIRP
jgi:radical SAM superfamily enzyme YgiQ (UPF0313 family)